MKNLQNSRSNGRRPVYTKDGIHRSAANVPLPEDVETPMNTARTGIGSLCRTVPFVKHEKFPTEEIQYQYYEKNISKGR